MHEILALTLGPTEHVTLHSTLYTMYAMYLQCLYLLRLMVWDDMHLQANTLFDLV